MATAKELIERRGALVAEMRQLAEENADNWSEEQEQRWTQINADVDTLKEQIDAIEAADYRRARVEEIATRITETSRALRPSFLADMRDTNREQEVAGPEHRAVALQAWMRHQFGEPLTERHERACQLTGVSLTRKEIDIPITDTLFQRQLHDRIRDLHPAQFARALSALQDSGGAVTIDQGFIATVEQALLFYGPMRQTSEVLRTAQGNDLPWPTVNDTTNTASRVGENATISDTDVTFGSVTFRAYKYTTMVRVPWELLDDTAVNLSALLGALLGERISRKQNTDFTTGTGGDSPKGITLSSTAGKTTASATAIAADELIDLLYSVDPSYRTMSAAWMAHNGIWQAIRKLKDGNGQYLWQPGMQMGQPDVMLGHRIWMNNDMQSTVATATKTVLFGDLSKYKIRDVNSVTIRTLQERYADSGQIGVLGWMRSDGHLIDAGTNPVKHLLQA